MRQGPGSQAFSHRLAPSPEVREFEVTYWAMFDRVYAAAHRVLQDRSHAEEVAQEVFVELWLGKRRIDSDRGSLESLLVTIAHHRAVDRVRSTVALHHREQATSLTIDLRNDVADEVQVRLDQAELGPAIQSLNSEQRHALELAFFGDRSYREVARTLEIPEGTAKSRIRSALRQLRSQLKPDD